MANSPASINTEFKYVAGTHIITMDQLSELVGHPTAFRKLVNMHVPAEIAVKTAFDAEAGYKDKEELLYVPEFYRGEDGAVLPYKDFWLQIHITDTTHNPIMGIKFTALGEDKFEIATPYLTSIADNGELYYRPVLGHHAISNIEALIHNELQKPLKIEPTFPPAPKAR